MASIYVTARNAEVAKKKAIREILHVAGKEYVVTNVNYLSGTVRPTLHNYQVVYRKRKRR